MAWTEYTDDTYWEADSVVSNIVWDGSGWVVDRNPTDNGAGKLRPIGTWHKLLRFPSMRLTVEVTNDSTEDSYAILLGASDAFISSFVALPDAGGVVVSTVTFAGDDLTGIEVISAAEPPGYTVYEDIRITKIEFGYDEGQFWTEFNDAEEQFIS